MKIKKANKRDFNNIATLMINEYSKPPYNEKWTKNGAIKTLEYDSKYYDIHIGIVGKKIVGFIISGVEVYNDKKGIYCYELVVGNKFQGKGYGKELMSFIENRCSQIGGSYVHLSANIKSKAFKFYKKLGYEHSKNFVRMAKEI